MEKITAESWADAFGMTMLLNAAAAAITGIIYLILGIFVPSASLGDEVGKAAIIVMAVLVLIATPLLYLWGKGLWERKVWSRILVLVASWLGVAFTLLLIFGSVVLILAPEAESHLIGAVLLLIALFIAAYCIFVIWLFTRPEVAAAFGKRRAFAWNEATKAAIIRAWSLIMWVNAVAIGLFGAILILASPFIVRIAAGFIPQFSFPALIGITVLIGLVLIGAGAIVHLIAKGLWGFKEWARKTLIALAYISVFLSAVNLVMAFVNYVSVTAVADALSNLIYAGGLAAFGIWFLKDTKRMFIEEKAKKVRRTARR